MSHGSASISKRELSLRVKDLEERSSAVVADAVNAPVKHGGLQLVSPNSPKVVQWDSLAHPSETIADRTMYSVCKRCFDVVGASLAIVILLPALVAIVGYSYASGTSGGSVFFRHRRVGRAGKPFYCLKFRTMVRNADTVLNNMLESNHAMRAEWLRDHKLKDDPRVTPFGRFLRRSSLDELPQLWNVLKGEMSLVGPRPVVPDELLRYGTKAKIYLSTRPGITGLWQVSGRNNNEYRRRVAIDVYYVRTRCLRLDLYILLKTLPAVFATDGAY